MAMQVSLVSVFVGKGSQSRDLIQGHNQMFSQLLRKNKSP